jgi:hypothetical protein
VIEEHGTNEGVGKRSRRRSMRALRKGFGGERADGGDEVDESFEDVGAGNKRADLVNIAAPMANFF